MYKLFLMMFCVLAVFPVNAQFLDVNRISRPKTSRSIMFQNEPSLEMNEKQSNEKKEEKKKVVPTKRAKVTNVSLFPSGDAKIMAVVNGEAISSADVESYAKLFMVNTGVPLNNKTKPMIINKVLQTAIDDKIKKQEAEKNQLSVSDKDLRSAMAYYEKARKLPKGSFDKILKKEKINPEIFKEQVKTELLWARLIKRKMSSDSYITQREIEEAIARSREDMKSPKYMVSEIVIPVAKAKNIDVLVENIRRDKIFSMYAAQFSQSPSASNGGNLGWLKEGQLPDVLEKKIKNMKVGQISQPIKYGNDYYILQLTDKFIPTKKIKDISFDDMKNVLENERLQGFSAKLLQNLRQKAIIELKA